ncbi:glycosyl hydrolase family 28-related protein [Pseudonocardia sediminis]|nr:glycosyl hydrolase family 28-related protein [Pseudonocardia sediminis]
MVDDDGNPATGYTLTVQSSQSRLQDNTSRRVIFPEPDVLTPSITDGYVWVDVVSDTDTDLSPTGRQHKITLKKGATVVQTWFVSVDHAQATQLRFDNVTQAIVGSGGTQRDAVYLTSLQDFSDAPNVSGGGTVNLTNYFTKTETTSGISAAVTALKAESDPFTQYATNDELTAAATPDATTSVKGRSRILGGTADAPTVPWGSVTSKPTIPTGKLADATDLDQTGAATGRDHAVRLVSAGQYALVSLGSLNVKSFGAKGDDTTDDTAAIQAAFAAVPAAGGQVFFPAGTYRVTSGLTCANQVKLVGVGHGSMYGLGGSRINFTPTTGVALTLSGVGSVVQDLAVEHAAWQTSRATAGAGIRLAAVTHCALDRVMVIGFWNNVECLEGEYYTITDCKILEFAHYGLLLAHDSSNDHGDQAIYGNHIGKFRDTTPGGTAVYWRSGGGVRFQNNKINAFGQTGEPNTARLAKGIHLDIADFTSTSVFPIVGNSIENFTEHGILISGNAGNIDKVTITANELASFVPGSVGIETAQSSFIYSFNCSANTINDVGTAIRLKRVREGAVIGNSGTSVYDYGIRCGEAVIKMDFGRNKWPSETTYPWFFDNSGYPPLSDNTFETTLFINSTTTPIDLFEIGFTQYGRGFVEVEITGGVDSVSANAYLFKRLIEANANGQDPGQVTIGTDVASGGNMTAAIVTAGQADPKCVLRITRSGGTNINLTVKVRAYGQGLKHVKQLVA